MPTNPATVILAVIASIAATVWLIAAYYLANSPAMAARRARGDEGSASPESGYAPGPTTIVGRVEVDGTPVEILGGSERLSLAKDWGRAARSGSANGATSNSPS